MLELIELSRRFNDTVALDGMSFNVEPGKVVGFLGPNGAGKTTAMRAVMGLCALDSGEILWKGATLDLSTRRSFGYMPEERGLYPAMRVSDQLYHFGMLHGMSKADAVQEAVRWMDELSVSDLARQPLQSLSLGNQQRVQLIASLIHSPPLLILDEPFSGLDPSGIEQLSMILRNMTRQGVAVLFSSHQLDLVENTCDEVQIINKGKIVASGSLKQLTERSDIVDIGIKPYTEMQNCTNELSSNDGFRVVRVNEKEDYVNYRVQLVRENSTGLLFDAARLQGDIVSFGFSKQKLSEVFKKAVANETVLEA